MSLRTKSIAFGIASMTILVTSLASQSPVPEYPADYRSWTHVKSVLVSKESPLFDSIGGIHHVYANELAAPVLKGEQPLPYPDGSVFVFDLLAVHTVEGSTTEHERKSLGVIEKNSSLYPDTGGWGFVQFAGDTNISTGAHPGACFGCHRNAKDSDFVFTKWRS